MRKNNRQSKLSDNIKRNCSDHVKKGKKMQKKAASSRQIIQVVLPGTRYRKGQWIKKKIIDAIDVRVLKSASEDLEGIGNECLTLWKMSVEETEELKQQVKQEALHKKRENIMPLVMQMSKDQIETAYEGIIKQWHIPDNLPSEDFEDQCDCGENASDEENEDEKELPRNSDIFSQDTCISLASNFSSCDIIPSSSYFMSDDKNCNMTSSAEDLRTCCEDKSPGVTDIWCDSLDLNVLQPHPTEAKDLEAAGHDKIPIVSMSFEKSLMAAVSKADHIPQEDFVAPLLTENSRVPEPKKLSYEVSEKVHNCNSEEANSKESFSEVSEKVHNCNSEEANSKESFSESVKEKTQTDDCNSYLKNLSIPFSNIPDSAVVTNDHSFTNIKTTISPSEFCFSDCLSAGPAAYGTCSTEYSETSRDLNLRPRLIKRKCTAKAAPSKKMKFYVTDLSCLVSESPKTENQSISLTADCASDKNSTVTPTNACTAIPCTVVQQVQTVAPNEEPNLECSTLLEEWQTPISFNCNCDVQRSWDSETKKQTNDMSVVLGRFPNKGNDPIELDPNVSAELKLQEVNKNAVTFSVQTHGSKSVLNVPKPDSGLKKGNILFEHINVDGSYCRKDHKGIDYADAKKKDMDLATHCDKGLESMPKNHLNPAVEKKDDSDKVNDKTSSDEVEKSHVNNQVMENDQKVTEGVYRHAVARSKESVGEHMKLKHVSELTVSQAKHKANTRQLQSAEESKIKDVILVGFEDKQNDSDKQSNLVSEQGKMNAISNAKKVSTANNTNLQVQVVMEKGKKEMANDMKLCQSQGNEHNNGRKNTMKKLGLCKTQVNLRCKDTAGSTSISNLCQRETRGGNCNDMSDFHQTEIFQVVNKKKVTNKDIELCQSEITESSSNKKFTGSDSDHVQGEIIKSSGNKKLTAKDAGPSQNETIKSSSKTTDSVLLEIEVTGVEDAARDLSMNQNSPKSRALLSTISAKSLHKKVHRRTPNEHWSKTNCEKDWHLETQKRENSGDSTSCSSRNNLDINYCGHISPETSKTESDNTHYASTYLGNNQNEKIFSETKNHIATDKLQGSTKCIVKLKTSNCDSYKNKSRCNTTVPQTEASVLSISSCTVTRKLDHVQVHDRNRPFVNHDSSQNFAVSANMCNSVTDESTKEFTCESSEDEHCKQHNFCKSENLFCQPTTEPKVPREIDLMAVGDSTLSRNEHTSSRSKDRSFAVKRNSCEPDAVLKNNCLVMRNGNFCLLDYSDSSNSELSDSGNVLSNELISGINSYRSNEVILPIRSPSPQSANSPSEVDPQILVSGKPLQEKEPMAIPLMVEDPKVRNLLEHLCKAEILQFLGDG